VGKMPTTSNQVTALCALLESIKRHRIRTSATLVLLVHFRCKDLLPVLSAQQAGGRTQKEAPLASSAGEEACSVAEQPRALLVQLAFIAMAQQTTAQGAWAELYADAQRDHQQQGQKHVFARSAT